MVEFGKQPAPLVHSSRHEDAGDDELSVEGLSGELEDSQPLAPHALGGPKHSADTLANLNTKISDGTVDKTTDTRTPAAHKASHQSGGGDAINVSGLTGSTALAIIGDATAGRVLRSMYFWIQNGTNGSTIKIAGTGLFNCGDIAEENNLGKAGDTGNFALTASGREVTVNISGVIGNCIAVLSSNYYENKTGQAVTLKATALANDMSLLFMDDLTGDSADLTVLVDTGWIYAKVTFITAS